MVATGDFRWWPFQWCCIGLVVWIILPASPAPQPACLWSSDLSGSARSLSDGSSFAANRNRDRQFRLSGQGHSVGRFGCSHLDGHQCPIAKLDAHSNDRWATTTVSSTDFDCSSNPSAGLHYSTRAKCRRDNLCLESCKESMWVGRYGPACRESSFAYRTSNYDSCHWWFGSEEGESIKRGGSTGRVRGGSTYQSGVGYCLSSTCGSDWLRTFSGGGTNTRTSGRPKGQSDQTGGSTIYRFLGVDPLRSPSPTINENPKCDVPTRRNLSLCRHSGTSIVSSLGCLLEGIPCMHLHAKARTHTTISHLQDGGKASGSTSRTSRRWQTSFQKLGTSSCKQRTSADQKASRDTAGCSRRRLQKEGYQWGLDFDAGAPWDAKRKRASVAEAVEIANDDWIMVEAVYNLENNMYSNSTTKVKNSLRRTWTAICEARGLVVLPLSVQSITQVSAVLKAAGFRSGVSYLFEMKQLHQRGPWSGQWDHHQRPWRSR